MGVEVFLVVIIGVLLLLKVVKASQNILDMSVIDWFSAVISFVSLFIWFGIRFS